MGGEESKLTLPFATAEAFLQEYRQNISQGGAFIPTEDEFEIRSVIQIAVDLEFRGEAYDFEAEVVGMIPGPVKGVAVQFTSPQTIREKLGPIVNTATQFTLEPVAPEARSRPPGQAIPDTAPASTVRGDGSSGADRIIPKRAHRERAQAAVRIVPADGELVTGRTRNLSSTGALIALDGPPVPIGEVIEVTLVHPTTGDELCISSKVMRHVKSEGKVAAIGVQFSITEENRSEAEEYILKLQASEHMRRMSGIRGPIDELGLTTLVQMFAGFLTGGTFTVTQGEEQARIVFADGALKLARYGSVTGVKALARILGWQDGNFEFHTHVDPEDEEDPQPLQVAILSAVQELDEVGCFNPADFPPNSELSVDLKAVVQSKADLCDSDEAVIELAQAGFDIGGILDVIPELDSEVYKSLEHLLSKNLIQIK